MMSDRRAIVTKVKRVVLKCGSSMLADPEGGLLDSAFRALARSCATLVKTRRLQLVIVSSGAIACGMQRLGFARRPRSTGALQACAATGQPFLMRAYDRVFTPKHLHTAQVLLTHDGLTDRKRFIHAKHTMHALLRHRVIPIVNENDTIAVEEIRVGDNDTLAAYVASLIDADLLVLLTDCDGLYTSNPQLDRGATRIPLIRDIDTEAVGRVTDTAKVTRVGGMATKLVAARIAGHSGIPTIIADGTNPKTIAALFAGKDVGTLFVPSQQALKSRKHWLAFHVKPAGTLVLDAGACRAIRRNATSLLAKGIVAVEGKFEIGAPVDLRGESGPPFARGLVSYNAEELRKIQGRHSSEIAQILGYRYADEVIDREELVLLVGDDGG